MSLGPLYVFLGEVSVQVLGPFLIGLFVFLEWSCVSSLYILEIRPLCEVSLANMFSYTVGSVFIFMLFSLAMQKLFILMRSHLFKRYIFHFNLVLFSHAEAFNFDEVPFVYSFLYVPCSRGHISENIAVWNI